MATFDAAPFVSLLLDEAGAGAAIDYLTHPADHAICSINYAEVVDRVARATRSDSDEIAEWFVTWREFGLHVVALTAAHARTAASLRIEHYHSRRSPISVADCCAIALASERGDALATSDRAMLRVARAVGLEVVALADSTGRVPD